MSGDPERLTRGELVPSRIKPIAVAGFAAVAAGGALPGYPGAPAAAVAALVAVAAAAALVYVPRLPLLAAVVATAAIAVDGDGFSSDIGWFAACLLAGWFVIVVGRRDGLIYWAAIMILFAVEWLWIRPDPGWGAWLAGSTLTVLFALMIRHQIDLNAQLRAAQAGLAATGQDAGTQPHRPRAARRHRAHAGGLPAARAERAAGRGARPGRRRAGAGRGGAAGPGVPGRGPDDGRDAPRGRGPRRGRGGHGAAAGRRSAARAGGAVPVGGRGRHPHGAGRCRRPARHHGPGRVPHRAGGADQRGQARAGQADRGPAQRGRRAGDADRGQLRPARQRGQAGHRPGRGQHARARRIARRDLRGGPGRPGLAGAGHAPARRVADGPP